ncbi:hypothetical protein BH20ACI2_BH20ACI2_07010 [soil metagenome]
MLIQYRPNAHSCPYLLCVSFRFSIYLFSLRGTAGRAAEGVEILSGLSFIWLIWWWLRDDSRKRNIWWVLDLGFFLFLTWFAILPYHLFKTRGLSAFIPILFFVFVLISGYAAAEIVSAIIG